MSAELGNADEQLLAMALRQALGDAPVELVAHRDVATRELVVTAKVVQATTIRVHEPVLYNELIYGQVFDDLSRQGAQAYGLRIRDEQAAEVRALTAERDRLATELARAQRVIDALTERD